MENPLNKLQIEDGLSIAETNHAEAEDRHGSRVASDEPVSSMNSAEEVPETQEDPFSLAGKEVIVLSSSASSFLDPMKPPIDLSTIGTSSDSADADSLLSSVCDPLSADIISSAVIPERLARREKFHVKDWDGMKYFTDLVREGMEATTAQTKAYSLPQVVMLYESPSSSSMETSFYNSQVFKYHDFPSFPWYYKSVLAPCRYSIMNGDTYPTYLRSGEAPVGLVEHWKSTLPVGYVTPTFSSQIEGTDDKVYAYLPVEHIGLDRHVHDPHVHYHLVGKDALHLMSPTKTPRLLANTRDERPCVAKVTHAMGSKGIFVIFNDDDEREFQEFLEESGNPTFVVTEFIEIRRNVACHFFIHPASSTQSPGNIEITWFGSNENLPLPNGKWSTDSTIVMEDQEYLKEIQLPFVEDIAKYCQSLGFWGFCGIDILFDCNGKGYVVDVNPRVTGTCPALMIAQLFQDRYGYRFGLFRRSSSFAYRGSAQELLQQTEEHNHLSEGHSRIVLLSFYETSAKETLVNIAVYGNSLEECQAILDEIAPER